MKRILYFFPDNVAEQNAGNKTRALNLLRYFKERGLSVDYVSVKNEKDEASNQQAEEKLKSEGLAKNVYLLSRKPGKGNPLVYFFGHKLWDLFYYWFTYPIKSSIPTYLTLKLKKEFQNILRDNTYDCIIISYVHSADLVADRALLKNARTIIDTHDFLTAQFKNKRGFNLGATFSDEIARLNLLTKFGPSPPEEQYIFDQFCSAKVRLVPMMMDTPNIAPMSVNGKKYDLLYVGNDNEHNILSVKWFFDTVYPLLPAGMKMCFIGKINNYVPDAANVTKVPFAESLEPHYNDSKIALCPMLQGTGVKVKVVEALAYGLPVVCTSRGIDGLPEKHNNGCLVNDDAAGFIQNIASLLNDDGFYTTQSKLARETFNKNFSRDATFKILDNAFE